MNNIATLETYEPLAREQVVVEQSPPTISIPGRRPNFFHNSVTRFDVYFRSTLYN